MAAPFAMATADVSAGDPVAVPGNLNTLTDADGNPVVTWEPGVGNAALGGDDALLKLLAEAAGALVIVTPGTDDTGLHPRVNGLVGQRDAAYVKYPESFAPVITGNAETPLGLPFFAPSYVESRTVAEQNNLAVMNALKDHPGMVVYTGYSQGAEAVGNAAEQQVRADAGKDAADKVLKPDTVILLISDPRSPWGLKGFGADLPLSGLWVTPLLGALGIDNAGARDPADTGDLQVISVIVQGDPVADWQFKWYRPASSLLVNAAGFVAIHSPGDGPYGHLDGSANATGKTLIIGGPQQLTSADGNTTYAVYDTYHPLALLNALIYDALGISYDEEDLQRWDTQAELFYPMTDVADRKTFGGVAVTADGGGAGGTPAAEAADPVPAADPTAQSAGGAHRLTGSDGEWVQAVEPWSGNPPKHAPGEGLQDDGAHEESPVIPDGSPGEQTPPAVEEPSVAEPADPVEPAEATAGPASDVGDLDPVA